LVEAGQIDPTSLSKAILRAAELVTEEQERTRYRKLENWMKPGNSEDPVSRFVLRVANLFPGRPMLNGLLCSLIIFLPPLPSQNSLWLVSGPGSTTSGH
jgi:hypothetical protein